MKIPERRPSLAGALLFTLLGTAGPSVLAHEPILKCMLLDAETVRCRGGYADGGSAQDAALEVIDHAEKTLLAGKLDRNSTLTFPKPDTGFYVLFHVGPGHQAIVEHDEIAMPDKADRASWMRP